MKIEFLFLLLLVSGCLASASIEEVPVEEVTESDEEVETRLSEVDLSDPSGEEDVVPENWSVENKLDSANKFFHGRYYANTYDKINEELVSKVQSKDREPNMSFAKRWLAELTSAGKVNLFKGHLVEALRQFTAMDTILNRCDRDSYAILFKNDKATRGRGHVSPSRSRELRRVDRMVYLFSMEHATYCLPRYSDIFKSIMAKRDFKEVLLFQDATIMQHRLKLAKGKEDDNSLSLLMKMDSSHICKNNAEAAIEVIGQLAGPDELQWLRKSLDERKGKLVVNREQVGQLVKKYLVGPCEFFIRELGSNVILPARYDVLMLEPEDFDLGPPGLHDLDFRLGQARFRFCKLLVRNQSSLVDSLAKKIAASSD